MFIDDGWPMFTGVKKGKHPCNVCAKRKVKCDRLIPCTNCVKRGQENECVQASKKGVKEADNNKGLFLFWPTYEYWVVDIGLLKFQYYEPTAQFEDFPSRSEEMELVLKFVNVTQSYKLLDYSMERLGSLYFGCLADISEIYVRLEDYWQRRDDDIRPNIDECYWDILLWTLFTQAIYYMTPDNLRSIFPEEEVRQLLGQDSAVWTESLQLAFLQSFTRCVITQLYKANFMAHPDIRVVQIFLILCNTTFSISNSLLSNSLLIECFHIAKMFHVDDFRPLINDSTAMRLTKLTCEKLWYRLCALDYLQTCPQRSINFHCEISSLLQHAAYLEDLPNTDIYESEDHFEVLYWKLLSLDRDLEQYSKSMSKPPLKTLDAIKRQTEIFYVKITNSSEEQSFNSDIEKFLANLILKSVCWKLYKMYFIFYDTSNALALMLHYTQSLISLLVNNVNVKKNAYFNKHPLVLCFLSKVATFYAFANIMIPSIEVEQILSDLKELLANFPSIFGTKVENLKYLVDRFDELATLWKKVRMIDTNNSLKHPVTKVLKNDVKRIYELSHRRPSLIRGAGLLRSKPLLYDEDFSDENEESEDYKTIVSEFEEDFNIDNIVT
ncbi:related to Centromere DNA-binding protein complex CBF3 subunit B [Zygosaccharomyces bailii]|nr:related to Centromere DNA-binding protein complex CBF3 subunit B [Zygosaccharomyces bailii]